MELNPHLKPVYIFLSPFFPSMEIGPPLAWFDKVKSKLLAHLIGNQSFFPGCLQRVENLFKVSTLLHLELTDKRKWMAVDIGMNLYCELSYLNYYRSLKGLRRIVG